MRHLAIVVLALLLGGPACRCDDPPRHERPAELRGTARPAPERVRREAVLMGTSFGITVAGAPRETADAAITAAFNEVDRIERLMSEWRPDSEISAVNRAAGEAPVAVSPETFEVIRRALDLAERSDGAFDPTWAALRGVWDFKARPPRLPARSELEARLARTGWRRVRLDPEGRTVFLTEAGMALGLGGIAKGYGIDRAVAVLRAHGLTDFIVDGGGDLYVAGEKAPGVPWRVGVRHPRRAGALLAELAARDAAIVTSGDYERFFELGGRRYHHIIDLRTGMPADRSVAVTVRAADATLADALATAAFVLGPERGVALARDLEGVDVAVLAPDGRVAATPGLAAVLPARWKP